MASEVRGGARYVLDFLYLSTRYAELAFWELKWASVIYAARRRLPFNWGRLVAPQHRANALVTTPVLT